MLHEKFLSCDRSLLGNEIEIGFDYFREAISWFMDSVYATVTLLWDTVWEWTLFGGPSRMNCSFIDAFGTCLLLAFPSWAFCCIADDRAITFYCGVFVHCLSTHSWTAIAFRFADGCTWFLSILSHRLIKILISIFLLFLLLDDIRCYCNLPACVSNGYMCRTARSHPDGGCFSERLPVSTSSVPSLPARHGCTNLLIESKESFKCDNNNLKTVNRKGERKGSVQMTTVMCCHEDMCNHEGTAGRAGATATKSLQQLQQRIKLNQQRDVASSAPSSVSSSSSSAAALTGTLKNSSGAAAAVVNAASSSTLQNSGECVVNNNIKKYSNIHSRSDHESCLQSDRARKA